MSHTISFETELAKELEPGHYSLGLWLPDASQRLRTRSEYAIRVANVDVPFWVSPSGEYGINLIGVIEVTGRAP